MLADDGDRFSFTPRIWLTNMNVNFFEETPSATGTDSKSEFHIPLQGATITYAPKKLPGWDFLVTGLSGSGTANFTDALNEGNTDLKRLDIEILARRDIQGTTSKAVGGVRFINYTIEDRYGTPGQTFTDTGEVGRLTDIKLLFGEFGVSGFNNITSEGKHRVFWNAIGGLGYADADEPNNLESAGTSRKESFIWTWDINIGYVYTINIIYIDIRYSLCWLC